MTSPSWFPDELQHVGDEHLDPEYVRGYDRKAGFDPTVDVECLREHGLDRDSTLVDLGCGTGTFALAAAPHAQRVVAVDVSEPMLGALTSRLRERSADNVDTVHAGLLTYEHAGPPADAVYARNVLHQLPDLWKAVALARIADILRPGGVLLLRDLVLSFEPSEIEQHITPWLEGASDDPNVGWTRAEYETHLREEHSTFSWLLEPMLEHAGFDLEEIEHRDSAIYSRYLCRQHG